MNITVDKDIRLELTATHHAAPLLDIVNRNREHLFLFLPWVNHMQTVTDFENYINNCEALYQENKEISFVITASEKPVGRIGLHYINQQNKTASIGYWLDKDFEGKGIATKSCKVLMQYGFKQLRLNRIEIKAAVQNTKSQAIPIKLGFTKEGILRQAELVNNNFLDLVLYSLLHDEWEKSQ